MAKYEQVLALWQSYEIKTVSDLEKYLDSFRILFAYHSGHIENEEITYNDTREIFNNGKVLNYTGNPRALFEQQNQKICHAFLLEKIILKDAMTVELVQEIHKILTSGTYDERRYIENEERPGSFKKHDYITGILEVGSAVAHVEADINALMNEMFTYEGKDILKAATYLHAKFEYIHPFADGNGRVGRSLMNYFLMIHDHPPLIVFDEDKEIYYKGLQEYDASEILDNLHQFFKYETEKTWRKPLALSQGVQQERKGIQEIL